MREIKCFCKNCGEEIILEITNITNAKKCLACGGQLVLDENGFVDLIKNDIEQRQLEDMKSNIRAYGNDNMWDKIERTMDNPYFRLKFRKQFFVVGGITPLRGIKI